MCSEPVVWNRTKQALVRPNADLKLATTLNSLILGEVKHVPSIDYTSHSHDPGKGAAEVKLVHELVVNSLWPLNRLKFTIREVPCLSFLLIVCVDSGLEV